jgi:hypothetical protein
VSYFDNDPDLLCNLVPLLLVYDRVAKQGDSDILTARRISSPIQIGAFLRHLHATCFRFHFTLPPLHPAFLHPFPLLCPHLRSAFILAAVKTNTQCRSFQAAPNVFKRNWQRSAWTLPVIALPAPKATTSTNGCRRLWGLQDPHMLEACFS